MLNAFVTPIFRFSVKEHYKMPILKADLVAAILEEEAGKQTSEMYSLKGRNGWHSPDTLCDRDTEWSKELRDLILTMTNQFNEQANMPKISDSQANIRCWAMVMREGDYSCVHSHPGCDLSGCYYVQVPEDMPKNEGNIVFVDPRPAARSSRIFNSQIMGFKPEEGMGLIFPNWLEHYVECHYTKGTRISVAWNLTIKEA